jgi:hypothetical protein
MQKWQIETLLNFSDIGTEQQKTEWDDLTSYTEGRSSEDRFEASAQLLKDLQTRRRTRSKNSEPTSVRLMLTSRVRGIHAYANPTIDSMRQSGTLTFVNPWDSQVRHKTMWQWGIVFEDVVGKGNGLCSSWSDERFDFFKITISDRVTQDYLKSYKPDL